MNRFDELSAKVVPILQPYVKRVAVFGSFARGEEGADSDIDLLIELKAPGERPPLGLRWFGLEAELGEVLGREVELVSSQSLSPYIRPYVEAEMVTLYYEEG